MPNVINATSTGNGGLITQGDDSGILNIQTNETTAITVDASQRVGVGTTSPSSKLDVSGGSAASILSLTTTGSAPGAAIRMLAATQDYKNWQIGVGYTLVNGALEFTPSTAVGGSTFTTPAVIFDSSGNLLVGTTSGTGARMDVVAADEVVSFNRSAATDGVVQRWRKAGSTVGYVSTNTYSLPSDERVKTNIVNIGYGLDFIKSLRPVQYNTIFQDPENEAQKNFGLIAQEVEQALADMGKSVDDVTFLEKFVPENDRESRYGLGYQNLVPVLIKAIQEQQATINALTARIVALEQA
jgi:hypothetical protein